MIIDDLQAVNFDAQEGNIVNMLKSIESKVDTILDNSIINLNNLDNTWPTLVLDGVTDDSESLKSIMYKATKQGKKMVMTSGNLYLGSTITINSAVDFQMKDDAAITISESLSYGFIIDSDEQVTLALKNINLTKNSIVRVTGASSETQLFRHVISIDGVTATSTATSLVCMDYTNLVFTASQNVSAYNYALNVAITFNNVNVTYGSGWKGLIWMNIYTSSTSSYTYSNAHYDIDWSLSNIYFTADSALTTPIDALLIYRTYSYYSPSYASYKVKIKNFENINYGESDFRAKSLIMCPYNDALLPVFESMSNRHFVCLGDFCGFEFGDDPYYGDSWGQQCIRNCVIENLTIDAPNGTAYLLHGAPTHAEDSNAYYNISMAACLSGIFRNIEINAKTAYLLESIDAGVAESYYSSYMTKYADGMQFSNIVLNGSTSAYLAYVIKYVNYKSGSSVYYNDILLEDITITSPATYLFYYEQWTYDLNSSSNTGSSSTVHTFRDDHSIRFTNCKLIDTGTTAHNLFSYSSSKSSSTSCPVRLGPGSVIIECLSADYTVSGDLRGLFYPANYAYHQQVTGLDLKIKLNSTLTGTGQYLSLTRGGRECTWTDVRVYLDSPSKFIHNYTGTSEAIYGAISTFNVGSTFTNIESNLNPPLPLISTDTTTVTSNIVYNPNLVL